MRIYIAQTERKGRAVFAGVEFNPNDVIEICPTIVLEEKDGKIIHNTHLHDYYFQWGTDQNQAAIALGYGSLYNHSEEPNAEIVYDYDQNTIDFICIKKIVAGEEITVDYQAGMNIRNLWFEQEK